YGYPIQQSVVSVMQPHDWHVNFLISLVMVTGVAIFSWHWIEKPILMQRKRFSFVGRKIAEKDAKAAARRTS
ncbi:MAG: acyltransferase, partial [Pseudomonadota bacterium]